MQDALLQVKQVVGDGNFSLIVEPRGNAVRIRRRGGAEVFVRLEDVPELVRALSAFAANSAMARA